MDCGAIKLGSAYDCANPLQGGSDPNVILYNKKDILGYTYTGSKITGLTLASGACGYQFTGFGKSVDPVQEVIKMASGQNLTKHSVGIVIFDRTQDQKDNIQNLILGTFVAVVRSSQADENSFELYGKNNGLVLAPGQINKLNENNGAYTIKLETPEGQGESKLPTTILLTDYATTLDMLEDTLYLPAVLNLSVLAVAAAGGTAMVVTGTNFYGNGAASDVLHVKFRNISTSSLVTQTAVTVSSNTTLNFSSVALTAGTYKVRVTTSKGYAESVVNVVSS